MNSFTPPVINKRNVEESDAYAVSLNPASEGMRHCMQALHPGQAAPLALANTANTLRYRGNSYVLSALCAVLKTLELCWSYFPFLAQGSNIYHAG